MVAKAQGLNPKFEKLLAGLLYITIGVRMMMISNQAERVTHWETLFGYSSWLVVLLYMAMSEGRSRK